MKRGPAKPSASRVEGAVTAGLHAAEALHADPGAGAFGGIRVRDPFA